MLLSSSSLLIDDMKSILSKSLISSFWDGIILAFSNQAE